MFKVSVGSGSEFKGVTDLRNSWGGGGDGITELIIYLMHLYSSNLYIDQSIYQQVPPHTHALISH